MSIRLTTLSITFKLPVDFGLFGFGLANAGVEFSSMGNATFAVLFGLAAGKTVGIFGFSMIGHLLGFSLPKGMGWKSLLTAGLIAGLGLTVALFVAGVAFTEPGLQGAAKMGALLSALVAPVAIVLGKVLGVRKEYELLTADVQETSMVNAQGLRVLVVEHSNGAPGAISSILLASGHDVKTGETTDELRGLYRENNFDLVLLDMQFPIQEALDAIRNIREGQTDGSKSTPIFGAAEGEVAEFEGIDDFIKKPVDDKELREKLSAV